MSVEMIKKMCSSNRKENVLHKEYFILAEVETEEAPNNNEIGRILGKY